MIQILIKRWKVQIAPKRVACMQNYCTLFPTSIRNILIVGSRNCLNDFWKTPPLKIMQAADHGPPPDCVE
jgi:hypothetical protein